LIAKASRFKRPRGIGDGFLWIFCSTHKRKWPEAAKPRENPNRHFSVECRRFIELAFQVEMTVYSLMFTGEKAVAVDGAHDNSKLSVWVFARLCRLRPLSLGVWLRRQGASCTRSPGAFAVGRLSFWDQLMGRCCQNCKVASDVESLPSVITLFDKTCCVHVVLRLLVTGMLFA